ncbi:MAG: flippase-like domain-containing protein [Anaerolineae bacterium]|nr:flippase-like domain-containing protein [Anaerolineae bacterium]
MSGGEGARGRSRLTGPLQMLLGVAVSAAAIWLLLRQVDLRLVGRALAQAQLPLLLLATAMYFVSMTLRAWRWSVLLRPIKPLGWRRVWPVTAMGYAGNLVLPARLGELLRAALMRTRGVSAGAALATIATERMVDGLTTVGIVLATTPLLPESAPPWLISAGRVALVVFGAGLLILIAMLLARPLVERIVASVSARVGWLAKPAGWALRFLDGLAVLRSPGLLARVLAITALAWAASITEYWLAMAAMGVRLPPAGAAFSISAIGLSSAIPAAPGYVGTQELVGVAVLGLWGVPAETALAASLAFHVIEIVPIGLVGLVVAWREGVLGPRRRVPPLETIAVEPAVTARTEDAG